MPKSKPIMIGSVYCPPEQNSFVENLSGFVENLGGSI